MTESLETKIRAAAQAVEPSPEFSEKLWNRISHTSNPAPAARRSAHWFWIPAATALTMILILMLVAPQNVMAAFRSLIAYLPGIGFVQNDESTLYLPEPVIFEQEGATLTIEQVVADAKNTVISYRIETSDQSNACFYDDNRLLLPDGTILRPIGGGVENSQARVEFLPLPGGITTATLLASMNFPDPACTAPQELNVTFSLGNTPPEEKLMPVYESPEGSPSPEPVSETESAVESTGSPVQFIIDRVVSLADGYLMVGHTQWADENWQNVRIEPESAYALDAAGKDVPLEVSDEGSQDNAFAFKIVGRDFTAPLALHVQNLLVWTNAEKSPSFSFEAGHDPQVGQSWTLNQELEVAGQKIIVHKASVVQETPGSGEDGEVKGYAFEISSTADLGGFILCTGEGENQGSWGQGKNIDATRQLLEVLYPDRLPYGEVTCSFQQVQFNLAGTWQIDWQPPAAVQ